MSRPSLAIVALSLVVLTASVAGAVGPRSLGSTTPVVGTTPGEPNHLAINDSAVAAHNTSSVDFDVGTAIAADSAALQAQYSESSFQRAYEAAETEANRSQVRERALTRVENETARLRQRNADAIASYANGERSAASFLRERARISARANELHSVVLSIKDSLPYRPSEAFTERINNADGQLRVLQGTISTRIVDETARGDAAAPVYAEVSDTGYTLARITDGTYVRETFLGSDWQPQAGDQFAANQSPLDAAKNRSTELYPWVIDNKRAGGGVFRYGGIYRIGWVLPGGELTIYLDGGTTNVFRESQTRALPSFNTTETINRTSNSLQLTVDQTFESGPTRVSLVHADTGAPIDGSVTVGDAEPVPVGEDGVYWFVQPRGEVSINATAGSTDLSVTLADG